MLGKFYDYQLEAFNKCQQNERGIVCMPTGTGKTFVQAGIIAHDIITNPGFRMYVINAPRIVLSFQLMKEVQTFLIKENIKARYVAVHSGRVEDDEDILRLQSEMGMGFSEVLGTTSSKEVRNIIDLATIQDLPLIFFSTYHSADRIEEGRKNSNLIEIVLNDEAHYLVQDRFYDIVDNLQTKRKYFFTATTKETPSNEGRGMNNESTYGSIIYNMTPREAIDRGKMVRPRMHFITGGKGHVYTREDIETSLGNLVIESFKQHEYTLVGADAAKMLVASSGTSDIKNILKSPELNKIMRSGVSIYAIASDPNIGSQINGTKVTRLEFLKRLKKEGKDHTKRMIIIHYDILTEGIDIPGITGVLFLRSMNKSKFIQTFGRAARLDPDDRAKFESGEIKPSDLHLMDKPYAYVIAPTLTHSDNDSVSNIEDLIRELREYGFVPTEDVIITDSTKGIGTIEGPEALTELNKRARNIGERIEKVDMELEDERIASLSGEELLMEIFGY
jgi:superfamily II DNA or RNA helicase